MMIFNQLNEVPPLSGLWMRVSGDEVVEAYRTTFTGLVDAIPLLRARGVLRGKTIRGLRINEGIAEVPVPKSQPGATITFQVLED